MQCDVSNRTHQFIDDDCDDDDNSNSDDDHVNAVSDFLIRTHTEKQPSLKQRAITIITNAYEL